MLVRYMNRDRYIDVSLTGCSQGAQDEDLGCSTRYLNPSRGPDSWPVVMELHIDLRNYEFSGGSQVGSLNLHILHCLHAALFVMVQTRAGRDEPRAAGLRRWLRNDCI